MHRLDMATSGVLVVALTKAAERELKRQFREREPRKTYIARVWGHPARDEGDVDLPLICDWPNRPRQKVCFDTGKAALTHFEVLSRDPDHSARVRPKPWRRGYCFTPKPWPSPIPITARRFISIERQISKPPLLLCRCGERAARHTEPRRALPCPPGRGLRPAVSPERHLPLSESPFPALRDHRPAGSLAFSVWPFPSFPAAALSPPACRDDARSSACGRRA